MLRVKRVYEAPAPEDGVRVLVDRLWPRGLSKEDAALDHWLKAAAPSHALRKAFHGGEVEWEGFRERYRAELAKGDGLDALAEVVAAAEGPVTLLYASRETKRNHARVLRDALEEVIRSL